MPTKMLCEPRSALLLAVALAGLSAAEPATCINPGSSVQCSARSEERNCLYSNCTDPGRSVEVSFRACLERSTEGSAIVYTYTNVTCGCLSGDVSIQVHLSNGQTADYGTLSTEPNPNLMNASRCDDKDKDGEPYSYCIKFSNLSMVEDINTSELVSEVTSAVVVNSSKACLVIEFPDSVPTTPMPTTTPTPTSDATTPTPTSDATTPTPTSGAKNGLPTALQVLLLPLLYTMFFSSC